MDENLADFAPAQDETKLRLEAEDDQAADLQAADNQAADDQATDRIIARTYKLEQCLGKGGMGVVYAARHLIINQSVAVKLLNQLAAGAPDVVERFRREAVVISSLDHANIVRLHTFDVDENDQAYLVMDLVEGQPLSDLLKERGRLSPRQALSVASQVLAALSHAHSHHIIHRDIKPGNIMIVEEDGGSLSVKVVDFGLAKILGVSDALSQNLSLTKSGEMIGSPLYMSPEQCTGEPLDERSDIYSLGCVLYEMLSGEPPFSADNFLKILHLHATGKFQAVSGIEMPAGLEASINKILSKAMAKTVNERYASAEAMRKDIDALLEQDWNKLGLEPPGATTDAAARTTANQPEKTKSAGASASSTDDDILSDSRRQAAILLGFSMLLGSCIVILFKQCVYDYPFKQNDPTVLTATGPNAAPGARQDPKLPSIENLSVVDPATNGVTYYTENPDSITPVPGLLATGDKRAAYTRDDSTIDGDQPQQFMNDAYLKAWLTNLSSGLKGASFADLDSGPLAKIAEQFLALGDMGRAVSFLQKLDKYGDLSGQQKARIAENLGDCYMYFNRFDTAAREYAAACKLLKKSKLLADIYRLATIQLKLAYCQRLGVALADKDYALEAYRTLDSKLASEPRGAIGPAVLRGDINLMRGAAADALLCYDNVFKYYIESQKLMGNQPPSANLQHMAGLLELRRAKAYLQLQQSDQALNAMQRAMADIKELKGLPGKKFDDPETDPIKMAQALLPPVYYTTGLAYEQKYREQSDDQESYQRAIDYYELALETVVNKNVKAKESAFAEMCLRKIWKLAPEYTVTYPDGKHNVTDMYWSVYRSKPVRGVLPPEFLPYIDYPKD